MAAQAKETKPVYEFGPFRIEEAERRLLRDGHAVPLTPKAFEVLLLLVRSSGHVVEKEELMSHVWADSFVEEGNLKVTISVLRKALAEGADNHQYIETVSRRGYRFAANVKEVFGDSDDLVVREVTRSSITLEQEEESLLASARARSNAEYLIGEIKRHKTSALLCLLAACIIIGATAFGAYKAFNRRAVNRGAPFQIGKVTRLTTSGKVSNVVALSPDGKLFAHALYEGEKQSLWLGHVDGGPAVQIHSPINGVFLGLTFAPDGSSLYYTLGENYGPSENQSNGALYKLPVFGGAPEKIKDNVRNRITFAPGGKQFAFVRVDASDEAALVVADTDGANEHEIARPPDKRNFAWHSPSWSPDGATIALGASVNDNDSSYEVLIVNIADHAMKPLTANGWSKVESVTWRPDGGGLIVAARERNSAFRQLWNVSYPEGETQRIVTDLTGYGYVISLSADNHSLLTIQTQNQSDIWVAPAGDLSQAKQVTSSSLGRQNGYYGLDWTPDGRIVYTARADEGWTIWITTADGTEQRQLIPTGGLNYTPSVTSDARYLVFQSNRNGKYGVWRANLDGGEMRQLTDVDIAAQPDVSPDGKWIVYVSSRDDSTREDFGTLYRASIDGGEARRLTEKPACWVRVSPDSRFAACGYQDDGRTKLAILPIEGGEPLKLFDVPRLANFRLGIRWTADGKAVTYRDWANGIWKQNLDGGKPERLAGLPEEKLFGYGWSRDGKNFAFTRGIDTRDVILLSSSR